jgi:hypothetical protein
LQFSFLLSALNSESQKEDSMKNIRFAIGLLGALLLANAAGAQPLTIQWTVTNYGLGNGWIPKSASDGLNGNVAVIYQAAVGADATFNYFDGQILIQDLDSFYWDGPYDITSSGTPNHEVGHAPSIAMVDCLIASCTSYPGYISNVIEVHQNSQDPGATVSFRTGVDGGLITTWANSQFYDFGFNPTVALDQSGGTTTGTTIVEVHQATIDTSALWYHVGKLTYSDTSVSASFDGSHPTTFTGYAPTVSVAQGIAVLMAQGLSGEMWYSVGTVDAATGTIAWGPQTPYDTGWNPSVSVQWCSEDTDDFDCEFMVVEVHQKENGTGPLIYRIGTMSYATSGAAPTSIQWPPDPDTKYANGCYPTVSVMTDFYGSFHPMLEVHSAACGGPANVYASWGSVVNEEP